MYGVALAWFVGGWLGCATAPPPPPQPAALSAPRLTERPTALAVAQAMIGRPYRYGGTSPQGFDCSGLVHYCFTKAGVAVPRTAKAQLRAAHRVDRSDLRPGDLLFFRLSLRKVAHVAIYAGGGRFIHAPSKRKRVSYGHLDDPYWSDRLVAIGRLS